MKPAAGWFNVHLLIATGIQALITKIIGSRTAKREILAALDIKSESRSSDVFEHGYFDAEKQAKLKKNEPIWIDYVADIGDGFDATFSVAWLMGRDYIYVGNKDKYIAQPIPIDAKTEHDAGQVTDTQPLPAGNITIFGGDQVYPYATSVNYFHRTTTPYMLARPWSSAAPEKSEKKGIRALFAIPGNHDWYDGLNSFIRVFCQPKRWIGAWQINQRRSYFSVKLPYGFWLWGIDTATSDDIDAPQLDYFKHQISQMSPNDQVILCVPKPAWIDFEDKQSGKVKGKSHSWTAWHKIEYIQKLISKNGNTVPLILSGDLHHYSRYQGKSALDGTTQHWVTAGMGGAFMSGTNFLPGKINITNRLSAQQKMTFPSKDKSKKMRKGVFRFVFKHKFISTLIGAFILIIVWILNASSRGLKDLVPPGSRPEALLDHSLAQNFFEALKSPSEIGGFFHHLLLLFIYKPGLILLPIIALSIFVLFAHSGASRRTPGYGPFVFGITHGLLHMFAAMLIASGLLYFFKSIGFSQLLTIISLPPLALLCAWLINGFIFSGYLLLSNLWIGLHNQEVFSAQSIEDWKGFLRMKVDKDGLTIYPIGIPKISRKWEASRQPGTEKSKAEKPGKYVSDMISKTMDVTITKGTTNAANPEKVIEITLIEDAIFIPIRNGNGDQIA